MRTDRFAQPLDWVVTALNVFSLGWLILLNVYAYRNRDFRPLRLKNLRLVALATLGCISLSIGNIFIREHFEPVHSRFQCVLLRGWSQIFFGFGLVAVAIVVRFLQVYLVLCKGHLIRNTAWLLPRLVGLAIMVTFSYCMLLTFTPGALHYSKKLGCLFSPAWAAAFFGVYLTILFTAAFLSWRIYVTSSIPLFSAYVEVFIFVATNVIGAPVVLVLLIFGIDRTIFARNAWSFMVIVCQHSYVYACLAVPCYWRFMGGPGAERYVASIAEALRSPLDRSSGATASPRSSTRSRPGTISLRAGTMSELGEVEGEHELLQGDGSSDGPTSFPT